MKDKALYLTTERKKKKTQLGKLQVKDDSLTWRLTGPIQWLGGRLPFLVSFLSSILFGSHSPFIHSLAIRDTTLLWIVVQWCRAVSSFVSYPIIDAQPSW